MRSLSSALQTAQASAERAALYRATFRDLRLDFDTTFDCSLSSTGVGDLTWDNSIRGGSCKDGSDHIHQVIAKDDSSVLKLFHREVTDLTSWGGTWNVIDPSGGAAYIETKENCRAGVIEVSGTVYVFYVTAAGAIKLIGNSGSWGAEIDLSWSGGTITSAGLAPTDGDTVYAFVQVSEKSGHQLWRCHNNGSWAWEQGPTIFTGKGQGNLYCATFISAAQLSGVDYVVVADHDDGRAVLVKYANGLFSDPVSVLPMDIVSDPSDTTMPSSQFKPYDLSVVNSELFLTGRLIRPGSGSYDFDAEVLLRGDGDHWTLDRHHVLWLYDTDDYVGAKMYVVGNYVYAVACQKVKRSDASYLVGVDLAAKKTQITDDIKVGQLGYAVNAAASLSMQVANADGTYDSDANLRPGAELILELGWNDNQGNSDYVDYLPFGLDTIETLEAYAEDRLSIGARSLCMKRLLDWRACQAYDYFSQCKIFEDFDDLGGFTEWDQSAY